MVDPALALLVFALVATLAVALVWPRRGLFARLVRGRSARERIELEDALKHLYKCEYRGGDASVESLAGALEIGRTRASSLLAELREAGLTRPGETAVLSEEGRAYALRIIRTHRLWERFLADRTGIQPGEWHERAEDREHFLTEDETDRLDARLGHPRYDPHGDPIPTASGDLPAVAGVPLSHLPPGTVARIVHLEDEPRELYDRLVKAGLSPGMTLRVLDHPVDEGGSALAGDREPGAVGIEVAGARLAIDGAAALNVTVERVEEPAVDPASVRTLEDLADGEEARVLGISPVCQGSQRRRLLDLGIVPGTVVRSELHAAGGDPRAFLVRGALVALRREQQRWIRIAPTDVQDAA